MAGDWIPMRVDLAEDPAVIAIAGALGLTEYAVVGLLHRAWSWANTQLTNGNARGVTSAFLNRYVGVAGFAEAMQKAGWLSIDVQNDNQSIEFVNFDRWNSQSAKRRILASKRVTVHRAKCNAAVNAAVNAPVNAPSVTESLPEKRREEKKNTESAIADSCPEPSKPTTRGPAVVALPESPPVLTFPTVGQNAQEWPLTAERLAEWGKAYPGVDCLLEAKRARCWLIDNPTRRKTFTGMARFLGSWMARAQNSTRGPTSQPAGGFKSAAEKAREYAARTLIDAMEGVPNEPDSEAR